MWKTVVSFHSWEFHKLFRCNFGLSQGTIQNETPKSCFLRIFWHLRQSDKNLRNRMQFLKKVYLDNIVRLQKTPKIVMYGLYFLRKGWLHADRYSCATDLGSTHRIPRSAALTKARYTVNTTKCFT